MINKSEVYSMKERDIVDFTKMKKNEDGEFIDENGNEVGCEICYTHKKAYEKYVDGEEEAHEHRKEALSDGEED